MKKSLLALAVLGAFVGAASAQSSVTIFGVVDLSLANVKNDGTGDARKSMGSNALNSNRLGFRGVEDLGGGLRAGFHLEGGMANDTGNPAGQTWQRRSTVSLMGGFGEVRLGRDYTPSFWNTTVFDPFGTNGVGSSLNISRGANNTPAQNAAGTAVTAANASPTVPPAVQGAQGVGTYVRSNNSVGYFLPALGGVYGQAMVAPGEGGAGKYAGGRIGFGAGPVNVALAFGNTEMNAAGTLKAKVFNIAGSYKIGPATLMAQYNDDKVDLSTTTEGKESRILLGANIVVGQGEIRGSWVKTDSKNNIAGTAADESRDDATQIGIGYIYNLSPRTALYATYASISNKGASNFSVSLASGAFAALPTAAGKSTGYEAGLRHSF
jgi:predicted porin